jgi:hypothetical protein
MLWSENIMKELVEKLVKLAQHHDENKEFKISDKIHIIIANILTNKGRKHIKNKNFACPKTHPKVTDKKDHFPIHDKAHASNAVARVNQYSKAPDWWSGSLTELKKLVTQKAHSKFPVK